MQRSYEREARSAQGEGSERGDETSTHGEATEELCVTTLEYVDFRVVNIGVVTTVLDSVLVTKMLRTATRREGEHQHDRSFQTACSSQQLTSSVHAWH